MFKVKIFQSNVSFLSNLNLLDDALNQCIPLEYSCKTGDCGCCSAELISGEVETNEGERISAGKILTCQCKPISDLVVKAHYYPELANVKQQTVPCKVSSLKYITEDILIVKLRLPPTIQFKFLPGQYIDLIFKGVKRSYSIANSFKLSSEIELHIRCVANGEMSNLLFNQISENQLMRIEGPKGTFFLRKNFKPLILLAGGTGIAPVKAILEELISSQDPREIFVYWGMNDKNYFYLDNFLKNETNHLNIKYVPVLSNLNDSGWIGKKGLVHQAVLNDFSTLSEYQVYACGSLPMIKAAKDSFISEKSLPSEFFFADAFTPSK